MVYLGPGDLGVVAVAQAALCDEVVDAALAIGIARIPASEELLLSGQQQRMIDIQHCHAAVLRALLC